MLTLVATSVLCVLALIGAYLDFLYRRLPNWLCLATFCAGIAAGFAAHGAMWVGLGLVHAAIALLVCMALFAAGMIGGGDAKFYAAVAAWLPVTFGLSLLIAVSLSGLLALIIWFPTRRRMAAVMGSGPQAAEFRKVPYGIAISLGGVIAYVLAAGG